tara:strand:+ start:133 stop:276 length:144 start_codon:yes stop_codon:yes gene_type:complete
MNYTYKKIKDSDSILRSDNACICKDENNTDYQEYLEWAKTNTIEEAD